MATRICPRCEAPSAECMCARCGADLSDVAHLPVVRPLDGFAMNLARNETLVTAYYLDADGWAEEMDFAVRNGTPDAEVIEAARAWGVENLEEALAGAEIKLGTPSCGTVTF